MSDSEIGDSFKQEIENGEDKEEVNELHIPESSTTSNLVHSPTTDTLDSVLLENPLTDSIDVKSGNESEEEIKLDTSELEDVSTCKSDTDDVKVDGEKMIDDTGNMKEEHAKLPEPTNISSYFSSQPLSSGAEFFDNLVTSTDVDTNSDMLQTIQQTVNTDLVEKETEQPIDSENNVENEGETVEFEGEVGIHGDTDVVPVTEMQPEDNFESFTAEHSEVVGSPKVSSLESHTLQQIETPAIPTPTQLSPLNTPIHQPSVNPLTTYVQTTDRQISQTSDTSSSPFHQYQTPAVPSVFDNFGDSTLNEDPFTASICMSDSDRRHDAWIPSDATRHILITMTTSTPGSYYPSIEQLCSPSVLVTDPQGDPVRDLVFRYMGEQEAVKRQVLTATSVSRDEEGLAALVKAGCLRAAVDLTGYLLADVGQGQGQLENGYMAQHSPKTLQLWFCRFALLMRLRLYDILDSEMRSFNSMDSPDLYFEFYPQLYPGRRGSMVPFALRVLHAELPHYLGRNQESLDKLYYILAVTSKIVKNLENDLSEDGACIELSNDSRAASLKLWITREIQIQYKIASVLLTMKDYEASISIFESLMDKEINNRTALMSGLGRIYLQMGNINKATEVFKQIESQSSGTTLTAMNAINKGFLAMSANNFSEAYEHFKSAVQLEPTNTCAVNNMAVCSLYMCRLKDALNTLEALVHKDPANNLHEGILFNLCTLYELESSRALHKKQAVLDMVNKHKGDGFPVVCLKMS